MKKLKLFLIILIAILVSAIAFFSVNLVKKNQKQAEILSPLAQLTDEGTVSGISTNNSSPLVSPSQGGTASAQKMSTASGNLKIALLGDSMIDTFVFDPKILKGALAKFWPNVSFEILNYGVGATNAEYGLKRLSESYTYQGKTIPSLLSQNPDIVVVESFAYNHPKELSQNSQTLSKIISTIQNQSKAKIYFLVTIAPDKKIYANGIAGINWTAEQRKIEAQRVIDFLRDAVAFAQNQGLPLINAYQKSLDWEGDGNQTYINSDNIHPSDEGKLFLAGLVAEKFQETKIIEKLLKP